MNDDAFDELIAAADPAMVIVTTAEGGERGGCLVGFHAQTSIEPRRCCVWLSKANHTYRLALRSSALAVHLLAVDDLDLARRFGTTTGDDHDKFVDEDVIEGPDGIPLLGACPRRIVGRRRTLLDDGGDHVLVVIEPTDVHGSGPFQPLRLSQVSDLTPAHQATERPDPPTERAGSARR